MQQTHYTQHSGHGNVEHSSSSSYTTFKSDAASQHVQRIWWLDLWQRNDQHLNPPRVPPRNSEQRLWPTIPHLCQLFTGQLRLKSSWPTKTKLSGFNSNCRMGTQSQSIVRAISSKRAICGKACLCTPGALKDSWSRSDEPMIEMTRVLWQVWCRDTKKNHFYGSTGLLLWLKQMIWMLWFMVGYQLSYCILHVRVCVWLLIGANTVPLQQAERCERLT